MAEQFNFFAEADPQYIFAYMDSLALGEKPTTGENSREPFFLAYSFIKNELAKCRTQVATLIQALEQEKRINQTWMDFALAKNALCKSANDKIANHMEALVRAIKLSSRLERKFYFSIQFPLFLQNQDERTQFFSQFASLANYASQPAGTRIKDAVWEQYLAWLGISSMQDIFEELTSFHNLVPGLKESQKPWFAHISGLGEYFNEVIAFLDEIAQFNPEKITLDTFISNKSRKSTMFFNMCMYRGEMIETALKHRSEAIQDLAAFLAALMAAPSVQVTNTLFG